MDLDDEGMEDTFDQSETLNRTSELVSNARKDMGLRARSPSPAGSASSIEEIPEVPQKGKSRRSVRATTDAVHLATTMTALQKTIKLMSGKRKRKDSSTDSEDDQSPILVNKTFKVKDNGHDILDFEIRNNKCKARHLLQAFDQESGTTT